MGKKYLLIFVLFLFTGIFEVNAEETKDSAKAFSLTTGVDFVSSYYWRGQEVDRAPGIQPCITLDAYNFEAYAWGSYSLMEQAFDDNGQKVPYSEIDLSLKYSFKTESGTFSPTIVDYFYPYLNRNFSNYKEAPNHSLSGGLQYQGADAFPVKLMFDYAFHNDPDKSLYIEGSYPFSIGGTEVEAVAGFAKGKDKADSYGITTDKFAFVNAGLSFSRLVKVTGDFSIPVSTAFMFNPYASRAYIVLKLSL